MIRAKITLTTIVLCSAVVIVTFLVLYFATESKKNASIEMNIPKAASPLNYQLINIPGSDSCDHCHMQPPSTAEHAPAASHDF